MNFMVLPNRLCLIVKLYIICPELLPDTHVVLSMKKTVIGTQFSADSSGVFCFEIVICGIDWIYDMTLPALFLHRKRR